MLADWKSLILHFYLFLSLVLAHVVDHNMLAYFQSAQYLYVVIITNKFRGRAFYSRAIIDYKDGLTDSLDRENLYGELIYNISKDATITFKFGYDYPDEWKWAISSTDNGRDFIDIHTQKMFIFEAKSTF